MIKENIAIEKCTYYRAHNNYWQFLEASTMNSLLAESFRATHNLYTSFPQEWRSERFYYYNLLNSIPSYSYWTSEGSYRKNTEFVPVHHFEFNKRETLYITAIKNLIKQKEFLSLMYQVSSNQISDDEFNRELESNESKYLVHISDKADNFNFQALFDVVVNLGIELTLDEVSEMFGIDQSILEEHPLNPRPLLQIRSNESY